MSGLFRNVTRLSEWGNLCQHCWIIHVSLMPSSFYLLILWVLYIMLAYGSLCLFLSIFWSIRLRRTHTPYDHAPLCMQLQLSSRMAWDSLYDALWWLQEHRQWLVCTWLMHWCRSSHSWTGNYSPTLRHLPIYQSVVVKCSHWLLLINSLNTSAFVRVGGKLQLGTQRVWLMLMNVTFPTSLVQPTQLFLATTPRDPSIVEPVPLVVLNNITSQF